MRPTQSTPFILALLSMSITSCATQAATSNTSQSAKIGWGGSGSMQNVTYEEIKSSSVNHVNNNTVANNYSQNNASGFENANTSKKAYQQQYNNNNYNYYDDSKNWQTVTDYETSSSNGSGSFDLNTYSKGVYVYDMITNKPLYQKNANIARPIASVTKLMSAMVILDAGLDMNRQITIQSSDFRYAGGKRSGSDRLRSGDRMSRRNMLHIMLLKSENPAGQALARTYPGGSRAFIRAMNRKARSLGMYNARFGDSVGMDKNNRVSPADLAKMVIAASRYPAIRKYSSGKSHRFYVKNARRGNRSQSARSTNFFVREGKYNITVSKTGYIREAGKCLVMKTDINGRPAVVVMIGASSSKGRFSDARRILDRLSNRY